MRILICYVNIQTKVNLHLLLGMVLIRVLEMNLDTPLDY